MPYYEEGADLFNQIGEFNSILTALYFCQSRGKFLGASVDRWNEAGILSCWEVDRLILLCF